MEPMRCLEPSPAAYIGHLILCFARVAAGAARRRMYFVNLGDSYAWKRWRWRIFIRWTARSTRGSHNSGSDTVKPKRPPGHPVDVRHSPPRADGWYLRSEIIWAKPNPMSRGSVHRPTHIEQVFLGHFDRYFWDGRGAGEFRQGCRRQHSNGKRASMVLGRVSQNERESAPAQTFATVWVSLPALYQAHTMPWPLTR